MSSMYEQHGGTMVHPLFDLGAQELHSSRDPQSIVNGHTHTRDRRK